MNLIDFTNKFSDEDACIKHLKEQLEQVGVNCSNVAALIITGSLIEINGTGCPSAEINK